MNTEEKVNYVRELTLWQSLVAAHESMVGADTEEDRDVRKLMKEFVESLEAIPTKSK